MKTFWKLISLVKSYLIIKFKSMVRPLSSLDIFYYLKKDAYSRKIFKRVVARDRLPKKIESILQHMSLLLTKVMKLENIGWPFIMTHQVIVHFLIHLQDH